MDLDTILNQHSFLTNELTILRREIELAEESIDAIGSGGSGLPSSGAISKRTEENAIRIADLKRELRELESEAELSRLETLRVILLLNQASNPNMQKVVYARHIELKKWSVIAEELHYTERGAQKLYGRALRELRKIIREEHPEWTE